MNSDRFLIAPENSISFIDEVKFSLLFAEEIQCFSWPNVEECQKIQTFFGLPNSAFHLLVGPFIENKILTSANSRTVDALIQAGKLLFSRTQQDRAEIISFFEFVTDNQAFFEEIGKLDQLNFLARNFLALFTKGKLGTDIADEALNSLTTSIDSDNTNREALKNLATELVYSYENAPPSLSHLFWHLLDFMILLDKDNRILDAVEKSDRSVDEMKKIVSQVLYLLIISLTSQHLESTILTSDYSLIKNINTLEENLLKPQKNGESWIRQREQMSSFLSSSVMTALPNFSLLQVDDLLDIKSSHQQEINSFRNAIKTISSELSLDRSADEFMEVINEIHYSTINPAIDEIGAKVNAVGTEKVATWKDQAWEYVVTMGTTLSLTSDIVMTSGVGLAQGLMKLVTAYKQTLRSRSNIETEPFSLIFHLQRTVSKKES